jgi:hypothetical protein
VTTIHSDTAVHVHVVSTPSGDRLTIYTGPDPEHLQLSGILWCNRTASAVIANLLDADGNTFERSATVPSVIDSITPPPPVVTDIRPPDQGS